MKQFLLALFTFTSLYAPSTSSAADYYWIGGAGNWSDISHWATTSGGVLTHAQVPTADDDVYFDANSFTGPNQQVVLNNENIFCRNLDWTGASGTPALVGDASRVINIHGNLTFIPDMLVSYAGQMRFRSAEAGARINSGGHHLGNSIIFDGSGGWLLEEQMQVDSLIQLSNGELTTNGHALQAGYFYVAIQNSGGLSLGDSKITLHGSNIYRQIGEDFFAYFVLQIHTHDQAFTLDPGTSLIEFTSSDATFEVQANRSIQLHDLLFSNSEGLANMTQFYGTPLRVNTLTFNNSATIWGNLGGAELILAPGKFYQFAAGFTYPFTQITANGNCLANITIQGNETSFGSSATFQSDGQNITVDYVNLKNVTATGTSSFVADNSIDLGNTAGWTINSRTVQNLYWVGGAGDWSDPNHWSLTSGGAGGACIPSGTDNVFFDENSFTAPDQSVLITALDIFCRDLTWTGATFSPTFAGGYDPVLHIFGSVTFIPEMDYNFGGLLKFESQEVGKTITSANHIINKVEFNSTAGEWRLLDGLRSETFIYLQAGTLNTNDQYVECTNFSNGNTGLFRRLELGNTHWVIRHFPDNLRDQWYADLGGFELDAGTSTIEFIGEREYFEHAGTGQVNYHKVVFSNDVGNLFNHTTGVSCTIDTLQFNHGGYIQNDFSLNTLIFSPGYTYLFKEGTTQKIQHVVAPADCNQLISLKSDATGNAAYLEVANPHTNLQYLSLRDLHSIGPGNLSAQLSIDLGNNLGWNIDELGNRTLYWVGGTGNWQDQAHWSLTSGGAGGECVPTLRDDVIFDLNSFTGPNQTVNGQDLNGYYCRHMTWMDDLPTPNFTVNRLYTYGSTRFSNAMANQVEHFHLSGDGEQSVEFQNQSLNLLYLDGLGQYTLIDKLTAKELITKSGGLDLNDQSVALERWRMQNENTNLSLDLGAAVIQLKAGFDNVSHTLEAPYGNNTTISAGQSVIYLNDPLASAYLSGGLDFYNFIFTSPIGQLEMAHAPNSSALDNPATFNLLEISTDATIRGYHSTDTLIFAPGKSYRLEHNVTQVIHEHLQILGNNCNPIELFSTLPGQRSTIRMTNGTVNGDFIQMQDQLATGGASFFAGVHSTDIGSSNQGWIFDSSPTFTDQGFFGQDRSICQGESISLSAYNYSEGETYEWSTAHNGPSITVSSPGAYWAKVTFGNMCEIIDTVNITAISLPVVDLGPDTTICAGDHIILDGTSNDPAVSYSWQDGSTSPTFSTNLAGVYALNVARQGCISTDSIAIALSPRPTVDLGPDQSLCQGQSLTLDAQIAEPAQYQWQDGSDTPTLTATQSGTYSVQVTANGCAAEDQIQLSFNPIPQVNLGPDTSLCSGQALHFDLADVGDTFLWQDGSTAALFSADEAGLVWVNVQANGCSASDSVLIQVFDTPTIELGPDQSLCQGQSLTLDAQIAQPAQYQWQDGSDTPTLTATQSGTYSVQVTANGCAAEDQIQLSFNPVPQVNLGPDTSLCSGQALQFDFADVGDTFLWQDGSTAALFSADEAGLVWVHVQANGCSASDSVLIQLFDTPTIELGPDQSLCQGQSLTLDAQIAEPAQYQWQDGSDTPTLTASQSGIYSVQVTANGCAAEDQIQLSFNPIPQVNLGPDTSLCSGQALQFDFADVGDTFLWQDGSTAALFSVDEAGLVWVNVQANGCSASDSVLIQLFDTPTIELGPDQSLCQGQSLTLDAQIAEPAQYQWQDGSDTPTLTATQSGTYSVQVTANGCAAEDQIQLSFNPIPQVNLGPDTSLCSGQALQFDFADVGDTFLWQDGSTAALFSVDEAGLVWVQVQANGCSASDSVQISLADSPWVDLGEDLMLCQNETTELEAQVSNYDALAWQDGSSSPFYVVNATGTYWLEAKLGNCTSRDSISVQIETPVDVGIPDSVLLCRGQPQLIQAKVVPGTSIEWPDGSSASSFLVEKPGLYALTSRRNGCTYEMSFQAILSSCGTIPVYTPNAFSPNDDGVHDAFFPYFPQDVNILHYDMKVFDRWGALVFSSQDQQLGWKGEVGGRPAGLGVYVYLISFTVEELGEVFQQQVAGSVTLLR